MGAIATLRIALEVTADDGSLAQSFEREVRWSPPNNGDRRVYSISATTFQALTVPSGADMVVIIPQEGAISLTLKGLTADTGIAARPASAPIDGPLILTLGATPSIGILNGAASAQTVEVIFI